MIVNLTPHALTLLNESGAVVANIPPSGEVARVKTARQRIGDHEGVPLFTTEFGEVEGLPAPQDGTIFVVSGLVRSAVPHREDVFSPGQLVRDDKGRPTGAIGLTR